MALTFSLPLLTFTSF